MIGIGSDKDRDKGKHRHPLNILPYAVNAYKNTLNKTYGLILFEFVYVQTSFRPPRDTVERMDTNSATDFFGPLQII